MEVHKIIKNRRLALGLTLKDVANALGVAESTISRYESTEIKNMGIDKVEALAKVLRCTPGYLVGWEEAEYTEENANILADAMLDKRIVDAVGALLKMTEEQKTDVFKYIRFISMND